MSETDRATTDPPPPLGQEGPLIYSWPLRQYVDGILADNERLSARLRDVTAERAAIWQALDRYGQHSPHCGYPNSFCKCGLLKVRAEFSRAALHQGQQAPQEERDRMRTALEYVKTRLEPNTHLPWASLMLERVDAALHQGQQDAPGDNSNDTALREALEGLLTKLDDFPLLAAQFSHEVTVAQDALDAPRRPTTVCPRHQLPVDPVTGGCSTCLAELPPPCGCGWEEAAHEQAEKAERLDHLRAEVEAIYGKANNQDADGEVVEWAKVADAIMAAVRS